jgi:ferredoxin
MTRVAIDEDLCQGVRECAAIAPQAVSFDAVGIAQVNPTAPDLDPEVAARLVATCPSMAITIVDARTTRP